MSTHAATPLVSEADLARLAELYIFRERDEVNGFLEENAFLVPILFEARDKIQAYFPDSPVFLEVRYDPEASDGDPHVVAYIETDLDVTAAIEALDRFDEDCGFDYLVRGQMKLNIDTEFR
jgi:hypothetical protein